MYSMWDKLFWKAAAERAIKTAAQTAILFVGGNVISIFELDWLNLGGLVLGGGLLSILTSLISSNLGDTTGPSLTGAEQINDTPGAPND